MMKRELYKILQKGSLMVEALALLGIITLVTPVMYKKSAERTTELQDINVANQVRMINDALDAYVRNDYVNLKNKIAADGKMTFALDTAVEDEKKIVDKLKEFLPADFNLAASKFFDSSNVKFSIKRKDINDLTGGNKTLFTSAVLLPTLNDVNRGRASKIASMIGVNGAIIKKDGNNGEFEGTQGAWKADPAAWFGVQPKNLKHGSVMSISSDTISSSGSVDSSQALYRVDVGDPDKNTMDTNLIMGGKSIADISALFGQGNELVVGSDGVNNNLIVKGGTKIAATLDVGGYSNLNGDVYVQGKTEMEGTLFVKNEATVESNLVVSGSANVDGSVTIGGGETTAGGNTLEVTGISLFDGNATVSDALKVEGFGIADDEYSLDVTGNALFNNNVDISKNLNVTLDANVEGNVNVTGNVVTEEGMVIGNKLHAKTQISLGGENIDSPDVLKIDANNFEYKSNGRELIINNTADSEGDTGGFLYRNIHSYHDGYMLFSDNGDFTVKSGAAELYVADEDVEIKANNNLGISMSSGEDDDGNPVQKIRLETGGSNMEINSNYIKMDSENATIKPEIVKLGLVVNGAYNDGLKIEEGSVHLGTPKDDDNGDSILTLSGQKFSLTTSDDSSGELSIVASASTENDDGYPQEPNIKFNAHDGTVIVDEHGMAVGGSSLLKSGGDRTVTSNYYQPDQNVIISRNGFIEVRSPGVYGHPDPDAPDGTQSGFIRARRLISDVKYPFASQGYDVDGNTLGATEQFDYYQVNPAYTSVMNDIKLATRGGARLSDILPNYVVKGIYVADNTYNEGVGLNWNYIEVDNEGQIDIQDPNDQGDRTECYLEDDCVIYSCKRSDCAASPWMGYVPRPQCPRGYQAVVTTSPIRWRMSEIYYLNPEKESVWTDTANFNSNNKFDAITDWGSVPYDKVDEDDFQNQENRFKNFFLKNTQEPFSKSMKLTITKEGEEGSEVYKPNANPFAIQTNTWLNSAVSPVGSGENVTGWHVLMGFLYRPNEYKSVIEAVGQEDLVQIEDMHDSIYWNIFPVYAQEMASIVTTYCAFSPHDANGDWGWNAGDYGSPVLNYDQLDSEVYRDPTGYSRRPVGDRAISGDFWVETVNDPSLPYKDAW